MIKNISHLSRNSKVPCRIHNVQALNFPLRKTDLVLILAPCSFPIYSIAFFSSAPRYVKLAV